MRGILCKEINSTVKDKQKLRILKRKITWTGYLIQDICSKNGYSNSIGNIYDIFSYYYNNHYISTILHRKHETLVYDKHRSD